MGKRKFKIKDVVGYEGYYAVTDDGRVWSKPRIGRNGTRYGGRWLKSARLEIYRIVRLSKDTKNAMARVHRLVAEAFIPNPLNKPHVNHINADGSDNRVENLEWCTPKENMQHASRLNLMCGTQQWLSILDEDKVREIRKKYIPHVYTYKMLGEEYGLSSTSVLQVVKRRSWKHVI